ncbi:ANPEP [Mytilus edulis]|uniref:ANPEP n=1 Tax=Mytilus edulis TaxID=6550 RepID=A0A8S3RY95_MYTED|nr:ANPEP [Mytilus edulis]
METGCVQIQQIPQSDSGNTGKKPGRKKKSETVPAAENETITIQPLSDSDWEEDKDDYYMGSRSRRKIKRRPKALKDDYYLPKRKHIDIDKEKRVIHPAKNNENAASYRQVFPESNRAGLIGDALNLARAQTIDYEVALNMTTYLKNEEKYVPWRAFVDSIEFIKGMISKQGSYVLLRKYLHDLVAPVFDTVGTSTSGTLPEQHMRDVMLQTACDVGVVKAINYAKEMFRKWKTEGIKLPSQYSLVIYTVGVREGSVEEWDYVWNKSKSSNVDGEREMLMDALAQSQKPWLLWRYANWIFDSSKIKMQDVRLVVSYFAKNPLGRMIALHLLMTKWERLNEQFGGDNFLLRETIGEVTQYVNTEFEYKQLERLFRDKPPKVAKKEAENALALMRANIKWMELNYATITNWLRDHVVGML